MSITWSWVSPFLAVASRFRPVTLSLVKGQELQFRGKGGNLQKLVSSPSELKIIHLLRVKVLGKRRRPKCKTHEVSAVFEAYGEKRWAVWTIYWQEKVSSQRRQVRNEQHNGCFSVRKAQGLLVVQCLQLFCSLGGLLCSFGWRDIVHQWHCKYVFEQAFSSLVYNVIRQHNRDETDDKMKCSRAAQFDFVRTLLPFFFNHKWSSLFRLKLLQPLTAVDGCTIFYHKIPTTSGLIFSYLFIF